MAIDRCETGVLELDQIIRGGIPRGNTVLLAGGSGMGKTTLALEFLARGAEKGEKGLYVSVTEPVDVLIRNALEYQFFDKRYLDEGLITIVDLRGVSRELRDDGTQGYSFDSVEEPVEIFEPDSLVDVFKTVVERTGVKRMVIDSLTAICQRMHEPTRVRDLVFGFGRKLAHMDCTTLMTSETPPREFRFSMFGVEEFIADGIVFLSEMERHNDLVRTLQVIKMRGTDHSRAKFMLDLSEFGISLAPLLKKFSDTGR